MFFWSLSKPNIYRFYISLDHGYAQIQAIESKYTLLQSHSQLSFPNGQIFTKISQIAEWWQQ